jgi:hypothetical protein
VIKSVAGATILSLFSYVFVSLTENLYSYDLIEMPNFATRELSEIPAQEVSLARLRRDEQREGQDRVRKNKMRRVAETLKKLDETEDIWLRRSPELHAALKQEVSDDGILLVAI